AMLTHKGGWRHRRCGKIYFWAMAGVALTAVVLSLYRPNLFLLLLAVFSFYQAFSGYRVLSRKLPHQGQRATPLGLSGAVTVCSSENRYKSTPRGARTCDSPSPNSLRRFRPLTATPEGFIA